MTPERWRQLKAIFHSAVDRPPADREAFLVEACAGDASLLETATAFLASYLEAPDFLEARAAEWPAPAEPEPHELGLEGRFVVRRRLGAGAFGVVYEVLDRERDAVVALKILHDSGPANLHRFKQEFRALADVAHPNLVTLYELQSAGGRWFFTMERIDGVDLVEHVRGADAGATRSALCQLAQGIDALHAAGKLHRDIKPSNVLVTPEGRVVLLDFGLVTDAAPCAPVDWGGTPAYMSPEQAAGHPLTTASDWYNVGAMLFEVLTGALPFSGPAPSVLREKQRADPPAPSALAAGIPGDLDSLCRDLLQRDPDVRPRGHEVLRRLAALGTLAGADLIPAPALKLERTAFVGRAPHLEALRQALRDTRQGRAVTVHVQGPSGLGKSALLRHFLAEVRTTDPAAVVVAGRCYEQESVPYKALDGAVDALVDHLARLTPGAAEELLPSGMPSLARLFPVMRRVEAVERACRRGSTPLDPAQSRRVAFQALRELLGRVAQQCTLLVAIDDLQWGDLDSADALAELLRPPAVPPLLFIASYRSEDLESPFLAALLGPGGPGGGQDTVIAMAEMLPAESHQLALTLLAQRRVPNPARAEAIARSSAGSPLFIQELVQQEVDGGSSAPLSPGGPDTLEAALRARVGRLPAEARHLLETVAMAGGPVELSLAARAADAGPSEHAAFSLLRAAHLVRTRAGPRKEIEAYHDRIRETVVAQLSPEARRDHHARLAQVLEASGRADAEALAVHFHASGQPDKAARHALTAAAHASEALAFDRAARLYRLALDLRPEGADRRAVTLHLAEALSNAGRGAEAATLYVSALEGASRTEKIELQRRAAERLLFSGHVDEGIELLRVVLRAQGQRLAPTPRRALLSYLARRLWLAVRGWGFQERPSPHIAPAALVRLDTYWSAAIGLSMVDNVRGADYHLRHLLLALRTGEPYRAALALATAVSWQASSGGRDRGKGDALAARAALLAERAQHPHATAMVAFCVGLAAQFRGEWASSSELLERAEAMLRERCVGVTWELDTTRIYLLINLLFRGAWRQMSDRAPAVIREAQERRDVFLETSVRLRCSYASALATNDPEHAEEEVRRGLEPWSRQDFTLQHYLALVARAQIALYRGPGAEAKRLIDEAWPQLARSLLLRVQLVRIEALHLRARTGLAAARALAGSGAGQRSAALLASVGKDARRIALEKTPWGDALASLLEAELCAFAGRPTAQARFEAAEAGLRAADMAHYAAAASQRRGELTSGDEGAILRASASAWMGSQGIRNPQRMTAMLAP